MEIKLTKVKELEIQDFYKIPLQTMIDNTAIAGGTFMWIDGILFSFASFQKTDQIIHKQQEGYYSWVLLEYSDEMPKYQITVKSEKLNREIAIYDMTYHPFYQEVLKFIKNNNK